MELARRTAIGDTAQPTNQLQDIEVNPTVTLGKCQGDCDSDDDCEGDLRCFQRDGYSSVPGCYGSGTKNWDYCFSEPEDYFYPTTEDFVVHNDGTTHRRSAAEMSQ